MTMVTASLKENTQFRDFFDLLAPWMAAYRSRRLTFVSVMHDGFDSILRARLDLSSEPPRELRQPFRTANLRAGQENLTGDPRDTERQLCAACLPGGIALKDGLLRLAPEPSSNISAQLQTRDRWGAVTDPHVAHLTLCGTGLRTLLSNSSRTRLERELLKSKRPFKSLEEWSLAYGFNLSTTDYALIEIFAERIGWIDTRSSVSANNAEIILGLAPEADPAEFLLSVSNADTNGVHIEEIRKGPEIAWSRSDSGWLEGTVHVAFACDAIIRCTAIYAGCVQHETQLADARALPNRARMMIEVADPRLERLKQLLVAPDPKTQSRDFEAGIALLLQMLGFSSGYVGALSKMRDEADIFALSPRGDVIVAECTTAVPDIEKVDKLLARVIAMRMACAHLQRSFHMSA
jgi:hypothetical protein